MAASRVVVALACAYLLAATGCMAYYLPGTYPQEFFMGQSIQGEASQSPEQSPAAMCDRFSSVSHLRLPGGLTISAIIASAPKVQRASRSIQDRQLRA